ncbi:Uncharacterized protein apha_02255 [Umezakia ovalisporum]|nr:Uncharacterized protein apha_02255 [Umezakia ovalisporum]
MIVFAILELQSTKISDLIFKQFLKMLGNFQQSQLRIEITASASAIRESLQNPDNVGKWLVGQKLPPGMPEELHPGYQFTSWTGLVSIHHQVQVAKPNCLRLLLSGGIDGFHEWYWGEGWVQSRLEGVSMLPLNLGQTLNLLSLRHFLVNQKPRTN